MREANSEISYQLTATRKPRPNYARVHLRRPLKYIQNCSPKGWKSSPLEELPYETVTS